jgi:hypothetical protein
MADKRKPSDEGKQQAIQLPIEWHYPQGLTGRYATHLVVQASEHEFHVSFFEIKPPLLLGTPEEIERQAKELKTVRAECVARVIVAKERMQDFIQVLQRNLEKQLSKQQDDESEERED